MADETEEIAALRARYQALLLAFWQLRGKLFVTLHGRPGERREALRLMIRDCDQALEGAGVP